MKRTVVEITDINGSTERGTVYQVSDLKFARDDKNTAKIEIVQKGHDWLDVARFLNVKCKGVIPVFKWLKDGTFREKQQHIMYLGDNKIRVITGVADWKGRAQKIKEGPHGEFITVFRERRYLD